MDYLVDNVVQMSKGGHGPRVARDVVHTLGDVQLHLRTHEKGRFLPTFVRLLSELHGLIVYYSFPQVQKAMTFENHNDTEYATFLEAKFVVQALSNTKQHHN